MSASFALFLHTLATVVWVGGMFFAYMCLRPVASEILEPPLRLSLWNKTFTRFFPWVWVAVVVLSLTGSWLLMHMGGFASVGGYVHIMLGLGAVMILIFLYVFFGPYRRLRDAVANNDLQTGGKQLGRIRMLVGINLLLGIIEIAVVRLLR
jgi:uncharacterized membrane protein